MLFRINSDIEDSYSIQSKLTYSICNYINHPSDCYVLPESYSIHVWQNTERDGNTCVLVFYSVTQTSHYNILRVRLFTIVYDCLIELSWYQAQLCMDHLVAVSLLYNTNVITPLSSSF